MEITFSRSLQMEVSISLIELIYPSFLLKLSNLKYL